MRSTTEWLMAVLEAPVGIPELEEPVDVINASLGYDFDSGTAGVPDNDASVLASIATAVAGGAVWMNSAGNYGDKERNYLLMLPSGGESAQGDYWDDDWLRMRDDGIFFNKAVIGKKASIGDFRMRWGDENPAKPARLNLFLCDDNGCTGHIIIGGDLDSGARVKVGEWISGVNNETDMWVRVCRDPGGGYPSWVQIGASTYTHFETATYKFGTINGIAESRSTALLAVGAASAAMNSSDVSYTLEPFSSLGPSAVGITKPDVVGVDKQPSTILATQVAEGTYSPTHYPGGRWPGTS